MEKISFIDLSSSPKDQKIESVLSKIREVASSGQFILGRAVEEFETKFSKLVGCRFGVGVNSGLDALILSLKALGIGEGDEVITAPNSFLASASAIALVGAKPVFVDVTNDFNLDVSQLDEAISSRTRAIMPVHLTGYPCDMRALQSIASRKGLKIVEDAAQAVGTLFEDQPVGSFGDTGCFSLHPLKNLHAWGDGGIIVTRSKEIADELKAMRNHGLINRDESKAFSYNSRLDTIQAISALSSLESLPEIIEKRQAQAAIYTERLASLAEFIALPEIEPRRTHTFHVYQVRAKKRDALREHLLNQGIETKIHYPIPIHLQPAAKYLGYEKGDFPVTERLSEEILSLPVRESLKESDVHRVCDAVRAFYTK